MTLTAETASGIFAIASRLIISESMRFLLTAPVYRGMDIDPLTMDIFPLRHFPDTRVRRDTTRSAAMDWKHAHQLTDYTHTLTHNTHTFNGPFSGTTQVSRYEKGKTNLDFTEARDNE